MNVADNDDADDADDDDDDDDVGYSNVGFFERAILLTTQAKKLLIKA